MSRVKVNIIRTENWAICCSNWANLKTLIPAIRNCTNGYSSNGDKIKDKEKAIKHAYQACKSATGTCTKYQDQTISYIATCKTSSSSLKKAFVALNQSKDMLTKVNSKINEALDTTSRRERTEDEKDLEDCASFTVDVALFVTYSSSVELDTIGSNTTIKTLATSISTTSITSTSCTDAEKASLTTAQISVNTLITQVETYIKGTTAAATTAAPGDTTAAPEAGIWAEWGEWSECDPTWFNGKKFRFRHCINAPSAASCDGDPTETDPCLGSPYQPSNVTSPRWF